jgi:hypothetical protein
VRNLDKALWMDGVGGDQDPPGFRSRGRVGGWNRRTLRSRGLPAEGLSALLSGAMTPTNPRLSPAPRGQRRRPHAALQALSPPGDGRLLPDTG